MQDIIKLIAKTLKLEKVLLYLCICMFHTYYICVHITIHVHA